MSEDLRWARPSPKLLRVRMTQLAVVAVPLVLIALGVGAGTGALVAGGSVAAALVLVAGGAALFFVRRCRAWGYAERADDLFVRRGVLISRLSVVPYGRMQFVDVIAGPFERSFGIATVRMHTASAASDARIPGLPTEEANRLRDALAALGEAQAAGL